MSAGIPHCAACRFRYAVSIGGIIKEPRKQLTLFEDVESDTITQAELLVPMFLSRLMIQHLFM